jgi:transposase InsO family protein
MARDNPTWGEERIAAEVLVKLGLRISPRTVRRYMARGAGGGERGAGNQRWATFVRNHAQAVVACDFCVAVTATFRVLYVFVALEVGSRRLVHVNVTSHPTAAWIVQQFREILAAPHPYRFVLHIPLGEEHLRRILWVWRMHYNRGRPHASLGPGLPEPPPGLPAAPRGSWDDRSSAGSIMSTAYGPDPRTGGTGATRRP